MDPKTNYCSEMKKR